ncbi:cell division protein FtsW [Candidatus Woesebacteria bacterium]|jgi:cell division protein FtsW|nr:cell division protein FtsW [Candidatus Woesebacteria bacterium]
MRKRTQNHKETKLQSTKSNVGFIAIIPIILTTIGLFFIFDASSINAFREYGDSFYFFKQQLVWFVLGIGAMGAFSLFDYRKLYYVSFPFLLVTIFFLIIVLIPGVGVTVGGARRWISLGPVGFQPSEIAKFSAILYLSSWFLYKERQRFISFLLLLSFIIGLIMIQPDLGTSIIIFLLFISIYFFSGENLLHLALFSPFAFGAGLLLVLASPYRLKRLTAYLNPDLDPAGIGYHIRQISISLASGGFLGRGLSSSRQKYQFLPEAHTDSIFAIIGEEIGFIGSVGLILLYVFLLFHIFKVAVTAKDRFGKLLAGSIWCLLAWQMIINLGAMVSLIPLTGVPLPFISYGGTSLLLLFSLMGIVISVARR